MKSSYFEDSAKGIAIGIIVFIFIFSAVPLSVHAATGNGRPYFSITLEAPSTNPSRRQWAAIVQNSFSANGITANLIYVASFTILSATVLGPDAFKLYKDGGFDAFFVGAGGGTALPDFGTQNVVYYKGNTSSDFPPIGSNWYWWKNSTYNALAAQYGSDFNAAERLTIAQKMVHIVAAERPGLTILYPSAVYAYNPGFNGWNTGGVPLALTATTAERDFVHWNPPTGTNTINMAETGDIDNINVLDTAAQNTLYSQNVVVNLESPTQEADGRAVASYACDGVSPCTGLATAIVSSADKLTWTESFRPHNFIDGVAVTADDYIFTTQSQLDVNVGWVGLGTVQSLLGLSTQFTYANGTTSYIFNGTYTGHTAPAGWTPTSSWSYVNATAFQWTMPTAYIFTNPIISSIGAVAKHIYEQFPTNTWSSSILSGFTGGALSQSSFTYTWNTATYGGNGSYKGWGPVTDGPYIYHGYDPVSQTATIVKNPSYWNATGLASINEFGASSIHFIHITEKTAAIAGLGTGTYNVLDSQYTFNKDDEASITSAGGLAVLVSDPSNGWQDLVLNDNSPFWGTGTATPLGIQTPSMAHQAALYVRHALSDLIPRTDIVNHLLQGIGAPAITSFYDSYNGSGIYHTMYAGLTPDPYDPSAAQALLAQAGYNTGVVGGGGGVTIPGTPNISANCTTITPSPVKVPQLLLGNSLTFSGTFLVNPGTFTGTGGATVTLQQSTDNGTTWVPVAFTQTNEGTYYTMDYQPTLNGSLLYRVFFTGVPWNVTQSLAISSAGRVESLVPPQATLNKTTGVPNGPPLGNGIFPLNVTDTQYSSVSSYKIGTLADIVNGLANAINTGTTNGLCTLDKSLSSSTTSALTTLQANIQAALNTALAGTASKASVDALGTQVSTLSSQISTLTDIAYAALAVAIILGLAAIFLSRRKSS